MIAALFFLLLLSPQLAPSSPAPQAAPAVRTEKLTDAESKQLAEAKTAVADAQAKLDEAKTAGKTKAAALAAEDAAQLKLDQANRELQGAEDGVSLAHHANTECGCYVQSQGRDYDRVEFKDDTIIIRHVHEGPPSLH